MSNKKVSIIIPVYNTEKYLEKCIKSALNQIYPNIEVICVDDGSTDRSGMILDELAMNDKRMIVIHQKNMGESGARNVGLKTASGDYIGFMDCDDWIDSDMYEKLVDALEMADADMAVASWYCEDEKESKKIQNKKAVKESIFDRNQLMRYVYERDSYQAFAYMWDKLYKKELLKDENGELMIFDENLRLGGDVLYLARLVLNTRKAVYIDKAFYHYLQRNDSGCHSVDLNKRQDWLKAYLDVIQIFEIKKVDEGILGLVKRFLAYHSSNVAKLAYEQKDEKVLLECQDLMKKYETEYKNLNQDKPERIAEYERIQRLAIDKIGR